MDPKRTFRISEKSIDVVNIDKIKFTTKDQYGIRLTFLDGTIAEETYPSKEVYLEKRAELYFALNYDKRVRLNQLEELGVDVKNVNGKQISDQFSITAPIVQPATTCTTDNRLARENNQLLKQVEHQELEILTLQQKLQTLSDDNRDKLSQIEALASKQIENNNKSKTSNTMSKFNGKSIANSMVESFKNQYIPQRIDGVKMTINGEIGIVREGKLNVINQANQIISYPEAFGLDLPTFTIKKDVKTLVVGDLLKFNNVFCKFIGFTKQGSLRVLSHRGYIENRLAFIDGLMNLQSVDVVLTFGSTGNGQNLNPMMLALMTDEMGDSKGFGKMLPFLMMGQQGGNPLASIGQNPMMLMALLGDDSDSKMNDILPFLMMGQGGFGAPAVAGQAAPAANAMNPMMLMAMMGGEGKTDMSSLMMMSMMGGFGAQPQAPIAGVPSNVALQETVEEIVIETPATTESNQ